MWRRKQEEQQKQGRGRQRVDAIIIHRTEDWTMEDHLALRDYFQAHELLPEHPEEVPVESLEELGGQLLDDELPDDERRRILVLLAHHRSLAATVLLERYAQAPHKGFARFAKLALDEASQWQSPLGRCLGANDPCKCGSGRKFKACCGGGLA